MKRYVRWSLAGLALLGTACQPEFEPSGALTIDSTSFQPTSCHVLPCGGIVLGDAAGSRLELSIPPTRVDAFEDISATPTAKWTARGKPAVALGSCGSLTLTGEGYHGSGKRAVSGQAQLHCSGEMTLQGSLSFSGCF